MDIVGEIKKILHLDGMPGRVLVLDGLDAVGHRVVERLIDAEYTDQLRVGLRTLHDTAPSGGAELVPFVWEDETTYDAALKDVKTVFVTLPTKPRDWDKHFPKFVKACTANGVKKFVKLSFFHAIKPKAEHPSCSYGSPDYIDQHTGFHEVPLIHKHALCDGDLILHKQFDVTILFATHLMSNLFRYDFQAKGLTENHEFYGASGGKAVNYVSPNDIAEVALKAIFDKKHNRQAYNLLGCTITDEQVATLLSDTLGTTVKYVEKPPQFFDTDTAAIEKIKATGMEAKFPAGDIHHVTGHTPQTFADYLKNTNLMTPFEQHLLAVHTTHKCKETGYEEKLGGMKSDVVLTEGAKLWTEKTETTDYTDVEEKLFEVKPDVTLPKGATLW
jgi:uncharacterized protein YbjT (DUF2867 family)